MFISQHWQGGGMEPRERLIDFRLIKKILPENCLLD